MMTLEEQEQREHDLLERGAWLVTAMIVALAGFLVYLMLTSP